jgi:thymidylate kinase
MTSRPGGSAAVIAVVGADGAGKSTLTRLLAERLRAAGVTAQRVDRWDIVGDPAYPAAACLHPEAIRVRSCAARMSSTPRLLFLLWASTLALTDRGGGFSDQTLLLDGYWMKHAASEIAYGSNPAWVEMVTAGLPRADLVLYLRVDPEVAWERKEGKPLPYECGMDLSCRPAAFVAHQRAIQAVLDRWAERGGWEVLDGETLPGTQADRVMRRILAVSGIAEMCDAN